MPESLQLLLDTQDDEFLHRLLVWLTLATLSSILLYDLWLGVKLRDATLLPPQRYRDVPWNGWIIVLVVFLYMVMQTMTASMLASSGFFQQLYGPAFQQHLRGPQGSDAQAMARIRFSLWTATLAFLPQLAVTFTVLTPFGGIRPHPSALTSFLGTARPYQFGWTCHRLVRNINVGFVAWLVFMPLIMAFNLIVTQGYRVWFDGPPEPHELERLAHGNPYWFEWLLLIASAVVMAPVWEELLFRGIILAWARRRPRNAHLLMVWSLLLVVLLRWNSLADAVRSRDAGDMTVEAQPLVFTLLMMMGYGVLRLLYPAPTFAAIFASALLFANAHAQVWPSPVPLFFLGLVLAWLAVRTQSLVAPIVLHALFNSVACVTLVLGS